MSSRSQDSQRLADFGTVLNEVAAGHVKLVGIISSINDEVSRLVQKVASLDDAIDELEHEIVLLKRG